jgi:hypothetical protein
MKGYDMTNNRKISINIAVGVLAKNKVLNPIAFLKANKEQLLPVMKEAEATEHWTLVQDKVKELLAEHYEFNMTAEEKLAEKL